MIMKLLNLLSKDLRNIISDIKNFVKEKNKSKTEFLYGIFIKHNHYINI